MRGPLVALVAALLLGGCNDGTGPTGASKSFHESGVPFSFRVPAEFATGDLDRGQTHGDVLGVRALSKLSLLAVRRAPSSLAALGGSRPRASTVHGVRVELTDVRHRVLGRDVVSRVAVFPFAGGRWELECQYEPDRRARIVRACARALATLAPAR